MGRLHLTVPTASFLRLTLWGRCNGCLTLVGGAIRSEAGDGGVGDRVPARDLRDFGAEPPPPLIVTPGGPSETMYYHPTV